MVRVNPLTHQQLNGNGVIKDMNMNELDTQGAKKGGGGGRAAQEAENTLRSSATVKVVEVVSEGEIAGIMGGAKGIYVNDTPLQNSDGSYNFNRVAWDYRVGLPDQAYLSGFPAVESEVVVNSPVTTTAPAVRTTSSGEIDSVKVTILLPEGLSSQNRQNGDLTGTSVQFRIEKKLTSSGTWTVSSTETIDGKTTSTYEKQYAVSRPTGLGTWDIRVVRITPDATDSSLRNKTTWSRITEIQDNRLPYNNTAYVGLAIDAESVGGSIPKRSYLVKGLLVQVPVNYNPVTRTYSGQWNGTFKTEWTDNPAWVLYDLLTNARYGLGSFITPNQIDKYSFYNAAVYNDELVPNGFGGQEPRFTFNAIINTRDEAYRILQMVAGAFRSQLMYVNGLVTVVQDRPASPVRLVTNANVIDGEFVYKSTGLFERHTVFNVTFNDRADRHLQRVTTVYDQPGINRYGYNEIDTASYGATTEGQAIRHGKWALDTELNQTETVQFKMAFNGFDLLPYDIVKLYDTNYTLSNGGGRIVSVNNTTVTLDRPVTMAPNSTIDVMLADGKTLETKSISQTSGTHTTITITSPFSQTVTPNADFIVKAAVAPRQFRIMAIRQLEDEQVSVEAVFHDPGKYARVETGITAQLPSFSSANNQLPGSVTNIVFQVDTVKNPDGSIGRNLRASWDPAPLSNPVSSYRVMWRREYDNDQEIKSFSNSVSIPCQAAGNYRIMVFAIDARGRESLGTTANYEVLFQGTGGDYEIENLQLIGGGYLWHTNDFTATWAPRATNKGPVQDYKVEVLDANNQLLRTEYVLLPSYTYTELKNRQDGLRAIVKLRVTPRDLVGREGTPSVQTFTNPPPEAVLNITVAPGMGSGKVWWDQVPDADVAGYLVWRGITSGFTPSSSNLIFDGTSTLCSDDGLTPGTPYFYKVAAYDKFSRNLNGTGLNVSSSYELSALSAGVPSFSTPPPNNSIGDIYFNTQDGKLYRWFNNAWTAAVPSVDITGTITATEILDNSVTTPKLVAGAVTANELATNSVTSDKIIANAITAGKIQASAISTNHMAANTINGDRIAANTLAADKILANSITTTQLQAGGINADRIAANSITATQLAANSVTATKIASDTITSNHIQVSAVGTLKIGSQAVTVPVSASSQTQFNHTFSLQTILSAYINPEGGTVSIIASATLNPNSASQWPNATYGIYDPNGTLLVAGYIGTTPDYSTQQTAFFPASIALCAQSTLTGTYTLRVQGNGQGGTSHRTLILIGSKR